VVLSNDTLLSNKSGSIKERTQTGSDQSAVRSWQSSNLTADWNKKWAKQDHAVIAAAIRQWHCQWVKTSDVCFVHLLLQYSAHAITKWIQIWQIWTCVTSILSFTR